VALAKTDGGGNSPLPAILCVFGGYLSFSIGDVGAKYLVLNGLEPAFLVWARFAGHCIIASALFGLPFHPRRFRVVSLPLQLLRGSGIVFSVVCGYAAFRTLQLVELTAIIFAAPLLVTALAGLILGERVEPQRWLAVAVGFLGVLIITRPGFGGFKEGHVFAMLVLAQQCMFVILTRKLAVTETPESLLLVPALIGAGILLPVVPLVGSVPEGLLQWLSLLSLGITGAVGFYLLTKAYQLAEASVVVPYNYVQMLWMMLFGYLAFDQLPDGWTVAGGAIVLGSGIYLMRRDFRRQWQSAPAGTGRDSA